MNASKRDNSREGYTANTPGTRGMKKEKAKLRVAVYSYAPADTEDQGNAYDTQGRALIKMVDKNPHMVLAGTYTEEPSSSEKRTRPQFLQLMKDCDEGLIDCILCWSICAFIRVNRKEIPYIRHLQDLGIRLIFKRDGVESGSSIFELLLTVLEAMADGKACAMSENCKIKKRDQALDGKTPFFWTYGYRQSDYDYEIVGGEAKTVRLIFDLFEHGSSADQIAVILSDKNIPTPRGNADHWEGTTIRRMIENEKYAGDYKARKLYRPDLLCKKSRMNDGTAPSIYYRDHHPAIISREQFERCNTISDLRSWNKPLQYPFGEYLKCPLCGHVLYLRRAPSRHQFCCEGEGACRRFVIPSDRLQNAILDAYKDIDLKAVLKKAGMRDYSIAIEAEKLLRTKDKYSFFEKIDFWWLDDLVREISIGRHSYTFSELRKMKKVASDIDDRTISIHWRCGLISTVSSGVKYDIHDPGRRAEEWDAFIRNHPDRYPQLYEEIQKKMK